MVIIHAKNSFETMTSVGMQHIVNEKISTKSVYHYDTFWEKHDKTKQKNK